MGGIVTYKVLRFQVKSCSSPEYKSVLGGWTVAGNSCQVEIKVFNLGSFQYHDFSNFSRFSGRCKSGSYVDAARYVYKRGVETIML
ncbi:hypothetical protein D3C85_1305240 [compost metagenome]